MRYYSDLFKEFYNSQVTHPPLDVLEYENEYKVNVALPGLKKEDIEIELNKDILTISGSTTKDDTAKYHLSENFYGNFKRQLRLPRDLEAPSAKFQDGLLILSFKKSEKDLIKKIQIK